MRSMNIKRDCKLRNEKFASVQHVVETYHKINFDNTKILEAKNNLKKLFFFHLFFNLFNRL